ncbi:MAG TPA: protein-L-isoaspartate(D-aspartate) O-methyltransferase [Tepidisphaeraceae bacterium]|jgi:protein-L-isoaspartate(D-aspartate) O-methyltransferase|nr:protein-L-isoaspartate(D-aspartate) O-methyltransferase [Tepidisphaeraceae bacterium]
MNQVGEITPQEQMIRQQIIERGIRDERVIAALRAVPRDKFFLADARESAFADRAAPIGHGQTISQPYMVALMTARLQIDPAHKVLEIGTGSGYHTAILCKLAREVYSIERLKPLLDEAFEKLLSLDIRNVHFRFGDGTKGWPQAAPFDRILVAAGAPRVPEALLKSQLADGGIAVLPVGPSDEQMLVEVQRLGDKLVSSDICPCRFVKLIGDEGWAEE